MSDIKINLLPWRADLREQKKKEFLNVIVGVLLIAGLIIGAFDRFYNREIDKQTRRNNFLIDKIKVLEGRTEEIKQLQQTRNELLARMEVIQNLQGNRPIIVRLFDELARQLAPRIFFTDLRLVGKELSIKGVAESNNRISSQLRNLSESFWFDKPNVTAINADQNYGPQSSQFALSVQQTTPKEEEAN